MTDAALSVGGSYYLPYQIFATTEQFAKAYPGADEYFSLKEILDPNNRFTNKLWQTYYPGNQDALSRARSEIRDYNKPEEQKATAIRLSPAVSGTWYSTPRNIPNSWKPAGIRATSRS